MAYCAHQHVSFLVRAVHSRQTELPLGKSALASLGYLSRKREFLFLVVLRSEFCSPAEPPVVLDAAPEGDGGIGKARPGWSTPERKCWLVITVKKYWNRPLRTAKVNVVE
jgi:hypothetical protein